MKQATTNGKANELLIELTNALNDAKVDLAIDYEEFSASGMKEAPHVVKMFTDNVVLGFPIHDDGEDEFGSDDFHPWVVAIQPLKARLFVRGGSEPSSCNKLLHKPEAASDIGF
ncbi:hypothetical protein [Terriglobus sp. TAA 43]|uniref:hypothetical protein n=1 Tax=Terriglobus sp. TAA 43 TaxID=278961 RepID=UPI000649056C|nr:hypothetical protein [Terriglobus sp. TAA 43]